MLSQENRTALWACVLFFVLANLFVIYFIRQEHYLFYWDHTNYWAKFDRVSGDFLNAPISAFKNLIHSIREEDYNDFPAFLIMPLSFVFGTGRLGFILSIVNALAVPAVIAFIFLHRKLSRMQGYTSPLLPLIAVGTIMFSPNFWSPIMFGFVDVGGIILINGILLLTLRQSSERERPRVFVLIAVLIPMLVLYRRWYAYWGVSYFAAIFIQRCLAQFLSDRTRLSAYAKIAFKIGLQAAISGVFFFVIATPFANRIMHTNYADIYSAYRSSSTFLEEFIKVFKSFGLINFALLVLGAGCGLMDRKTRDFSVFLLLQCGIIFMLFSRTQSFDSHQLYLLLPTMLLFSVLFINRVVMGFEKLNVPVLCFLIFIFALEFVAAFCPRQSLIIKLFPKNFLSNIHHPPLVRNDLKEFDKMLAVMQGLLVHPNDRIYVLASSSVFNCDILKSVYLSQGRHKELSKKVFWTNDVDKRDGFPQKLLTAQYVAVALPIQYHLKSEDQRVMGVPAEAILNQEGIGTSFMKLPYEFNLEQGVKVFFYQKIKPFNGPDLASLSESLKKYYPDRPFIYAIKKD